jgi:hypothetical protein
MRCRWQHNPQHLPALVMREQEHAGPLDFRKWGRVTGAEVLQMPLLLRRELDGILGQRSWQKDSPPHQA